MTNLQLITLEEYEEPLIKASELAVKLGYVKKDGVSNLVNSRAKDFEPLEDAQVTPDHRVKGVVSKLDTKTESGFLTVGSKRISFGYNNIPISKKQDAFTTLIESMKNRIPIFLIGLATFNLESELKKIDIKDVQSDAKLF